MSALAAVSDPATLGWLLGPVIGVLGTLAGTLVGARLTRSRERLGWQRNWLTGRIGESTQFAADCCRAIDQVLVVYGQCADAVAGKRGPVPHPRLETADAAWRDVLSTRRVYASEGLQQALTTYDEARAEMAEATNSRNPEAIAEAETRLKTAHLTVLDEIQADRNLINEALAAHLLPWPVRWWRVLRGQPAYPEAPLPSRQQVEGDTSA